jgi:hypothetical protein
MEARRSWLVWFLRSVSRSVFMAWGGGHFDEVEGGVDAEVGDCSGGSEEAFGDFQGAAG